MYFFCSRKLYRVFVQHLLIFIPIVHVFNTFAKPCIRTASVDIYRIIWRYNRKYYQVFVQHLLIFIKDNVWQPMDLGGYSYSICWYLSKNCLNQRKDFEKYSYSICWYLSLMLLGFINYIIIINYWYCKIFIIFTSKW